MFKLNPRLAAILWLIAPAVMVADAQVPALPETGTSDDPFPAPLPRSAGVIVNIAEFAYLPDSDGRAARMMLLVDEPGTERLFVNDMRGPLYSVSYDGRTVRP